MAIPKEYKAIKEYLSSYMEMQKLSAALLNKDVDRVYKTNLLEDDENWIAILSDSKQPQNSSWRGLRGEDSQRFTYSFYLNKKRRKVYLKATIKATRSLNANNFIFENLFKKIHREGLHNTQLIASEGMEISWNLRYAFLRIDIDMEGNYMEQINAVLSILDKYNKVVFDKLSDRWARERKDY